MNPEGHGPLAVAGGFGYGGVPAVVVDEGADCFGHAPALPQVRLWGKPDLTPGKITLGKFRRMDTEWANLKEDWERVRWARKRAEFATARAAAESLGLGENTYSAYERPEGASKSTRISDQRAIQFGKKFKVSWRWLLLGEGTPFDGAQSKAQERVLAAMSKAPEDEQERVAAAVEALLRTGTNG